MMLKNKIENKVENKVSVGINIFIDISIKNESYLNQFIEREISNIKNKHTLKLPSGFDFSRKLYRLFSIDPTKYRPSSEALWRRIKKGHDFPRVNPFVDLTNLLSLKYQICYGLYDLDKIKGHMQVTQGIEGDQYKGIRKDILNLEGKIVVKDEAGPFGNPSSDSLRTCTTSSTVNLLQVLFFHLSDPNKKNILTATLDCFKSFFNIRTSESYFLDKRG